MNRPKIIAFYLPQYHPIPENDEWWGLGFTDWVNVKRGKQRFKGHYQPHIPADFGYYDLRDEQIQISQAELAESYGISGFCYYHYWFNGKMLLEEPFNKVLKSGKPEFPFCLCWANENWTRGWDGLDSEILIGQNYDTYDPVQHIEWLAKAFSDNRYLKINNKPIFLIYNAAGIPNLKNIIEIWRDFAKKKGFFDIFLCSVNSVHNKLEEKMINLGFDAIVDFVPNGRDEPILSWTILKNYYCRFINKLIRTFRLENKFNQFYLTYVYDYNRIMRKKLRKRIKNYRYFPCVMPSWDNSARRNIAYVKQNLNPDSYKLWLDKSIEKIQHYPEDEQFVFVNAWNEWAEGCHLEPDLRNGKKFLKATLEIVKKWSEDSKENKKNC